MKRTIQALSVLACLLAAPAHAVSLDLAASDLGGNTLDFAQLADGVVAIDPDFATATPMRLVLLPAANDAAPIVWNALVDNLTGELWSAFAISVEGAVLGIGSAVANAGTVAGIVATITGARIDLDPGEPAGINLGAVFGAGVDWTLLSITGPPNAPIVITFTPIAVPEPASAVLLGLGLAALMARRRA